MRAYSIPSLLLWSFLAGCSDPDVVARVGSSVIRRADMETLGPQTAAPEEVLRRLVERELLAEEARRRDLDEDPRVAARLRAAEREILASAALEAALGPATSEAEVRKRYDDRREELARLRVHVRHIVVQLGAGPDGELRSRAKANVLYARVVGGEDFAEVAREASEDTASAARGGELSPLEEGTVESAFFEAAAALRPGEVSKPVRTQFGFHILQAIEAPSRMVPEFGAVKGRLAMDMARETETDLIDRLRNRFDVEIRPLANREEAAR